MRPAARALAYASALLIAFGALTPWATLSGNPTFASPALVAVLCAYVVVVAVATVLHQRAALGMGAVLLGGFAVVALWTVPGSVLEASPSGDAAVAEAGSGLVLLMVAATLLYVASWLPAPREAAKATADAQS